MNFATWEIKFMLSVMPYQYYCLFSIFSQVCNLTWWTLSEDPQRAIPLQKVSSISHRSSQGESAYLHHSSCDKQSSWSTSCLHSLYLCVWCCRLWASTAGDMQSGDRTVHVSSQAVRGDSSSQSSQCSRECVLVQILLCQCNPVGQR